VSCQEKNKEADTDDEAHTRGRKFCVGVINKGQNVGAVALFNYFTVVS
jgi:hypothetical protein